MFLFLHFKCSWIEPFHHATGTKLNQVKMFSDEGKYSPFAFVFPRFSRESSRLAQNFPIKPSTRDVGGSANFRLLTITELRNAKIVLCLFN